MLGAQSPYINQYDVYAPCFNSTIFQVRLTRRLGVCVGGPTTSIAALVLVGCLASNRFIFICALPGLSA